MLASSWRTLPAAALRGLAKSGLARGLAALVQLGEVAAAHIDLPAHLEDLGRRALEGLGHIGQGLEIGGDVLAHRSVAAGRTLDEFPALIAQAGREPVDLGLGHHLDGDILRQAEKAADAGEEIADIGFLEGIVEGEHGHRMADLGEAGCRRGANLLARAVGPAQLGKTSLDRLVALDQSVIGRVGYLRRILLIIELAVMSDPGREIGKGGLRLRLGQLVDWLFRCCLLRLLHAPPPAAISRSAAARASSLTVAPESMRAISSRRAGPSRATTPVRLPALPLLFSTRQ